MTEPAMRIDLRGDAKEYKMMMWIETPLTPDHDEQEVTYEGYRMRLVAGIDGEHDTLITFIPNPRVTQAELLPAEYLNLRTLSALTWKYGRPFSQHLGFGGSPVLAIPQGAPRPRLPRAGFYDLDNLQYPAQPAARALAFYRQGLIQADIFYKFLSYYRIVELASGSGGRAAQVTWINTAIPRLAGEAQNRVRQIQQSGGPAAEYLYESGRCAIAHAGVNPAQPVTDPDSPQDFDRIFDDLPVVKAIAEYAILNVFGVPR